MDGYRQLARGLKALYARGTPLTLLPQSRFAIFAIGLANAESLDGSVPGIKEH